MKAFVITVNGQPLCTAGIGHLGVLSVIVDWVRREGEPLDGEFDFSIGGLDTTCDEHVRWKTPTIGIGDEITIRVIESNAVDPSVERYKRDARRG